MNSSRNVICLRYIDDFLILGLDKSSVWRVFNKGRKLLENLHLQVYSPENSPDKASQGATRVAVNFLGCDISPHFVHPDRKSRRRLIKKIKDQIRKSRDTMVRASHGKLRDDDDVYSASLIQTAKRIHDTIHAWGNQYQFCNAEAQFTDLDKLIDREIRGFIRFYDSVKREGDANFLGRILGIQRLVDCRRRSILPLKKKSGQSFTQL